MIDVWPDPKPERTRGNRARRHVDRDVRRAVLLAHPACVACGEPATNADHLVRRGVPHFGDDDPDNMISLCGSGTTGCHGARHGNPYTDDQGRYWTPYIVRDKIGLALEPRHVAYVLGKLGDGPGREYLRRHFHFRREVY